MKSLGMPAMFALLVLGGCASQEMQDYSTQWDKWLGSTKDARVNDMGIPAKCHAFKDGAEVCEWTTQTQDGRYETIGLTFSPKGQVCQWSYRGFYGQRKSTATCS